MKSQPLTFLDPSDCDLWGATVTVSLDACSSVEEAISNADKVVLAFRARQPSVQEASEKGKLS